MVATQALGPAVSLAATLAAAAGRFGDAPAVVRWDDEPLGYAAWWQQALAVARWMARRGVGEGDRVAVVLPSGLEYLVVYAAASALGAVTAGVNPSLDPAERVALVELVYPVLVVADPTLADGLPAGRHMELVTPCEPGRAPWAAQLEADRGAPLAGGAAGHRSLDPPAHRHRSEFRAHSRG